MVSIRLDKEIPIWRTYDFFEQRAIEKAKQVITWVQSNTRLPMDNVQDDVEKSHFTFLANYRSGIHKQYQNITGILDQGIKNWREVRTTRATLDAKQIDKVQIIIEWCKSNNMKLPTASTIKNVIEKTYAALLAEMRMFRSGNNQRCIFCPLSFQMLDDEIPGWDRPKEYSSLLKAKQCVIDCEATHKWPNYKTTEGKWLEKMRGLHNGVGKGNGSILYPCVKTCLEDAAQRIGIPIERW